MTGHEYVGDGVSGIGTVWIGTGTTVTFTSIYPRLGTLVAGGSDSYSYSTLGGCNVYRNVEDGK